MSTRRVQLSEVCEVTDGTHYTPPNTGGPFPFLTVKDITEEDLSFSGCSYISAAEFEKAKKLGACPETGAVLFSKDGTVGKVHVVRHERPFAALSSIAILRPYKSLIDSDFLGFALSNPAILMDAVNRKTGSALQRIILADLKRVSIPVPELCEQQRIVRQLKQANRLRRIRCYGLGLGETFLPAAFLEIFGDLRSNPRGYIVRDLGEICDVRDGTHDSPKFHQRGIPLVTSKNLVSGFVDLSDVDLISEDDYEKINKRSKVDRGDILMPMIGTIGSPVLIEREPRFAIKNVALIKFIGGSPSPIYVRELLRGTYFEYLTCMSSRGGTQQFIALGDIRGFRIPVPPVPLQQYFSLLVARHERLRAVQREALRQAEHLFQSLLHIAFADKDNAKSTTVGV